MSAVTSVGQWIVFLEILLSGSEYILVRNQLTTFLDLKRASLLQKRNCVTKQCLQGRYGVFQQVKAVEAFEAV